MAKFQIDWTEECWYRVVVEADSAEEAERMLWHGEFDWGLPYETEIQDSVEVEELEDE